MLYHLQHDAFDMTGFLFEVMIYSKLILRIVTQLNILKSIDLNQQIVGYTKDILIKSLKITF